MQAQAGANISVLIAVVAGVTTTPTSPFCELGMVLPLVFAKPRFRDCIGKNTSVLNMWKAASELNLHFDVSPTSGMKGNG